MEDKNDKQKVNKTQMRVGLFVVVLIALTAASLGAVQISRTLKAPFEIKTLPSDSNSVFASEDERKEELKKIDTDKDGLSDYDEIYIYNTSPFIEDSDSDGAGDKEEILAGEDPNCPKGRNCFAVDVATSTPLLSPTDSFSKSELGVGQIGTANSLNLRGELQDLGVPEAILSKLNDEELQKLYSETLAEVLKKANE